LYGTREHIIFQQTGVMYTQNQHVKESTAYNSKANVISFGLSAVLNYPCQFSPPLPWIIEYCAWVSEL